jgi:hypothetical protein
MLTRTDYARPGRNAKKGIGGFLLFDSRGITTTITAEQAIFLFLLKLNMNL